MIESGKLSKAMFPNKSAYYYFLNYGYCNFDLGQSFWPKVNSNHILTSIRTFRQNGESVWLPGRE